MKWINQMLDFCLVVTSFFFNTPDFVSSKISCRFKPAYFLTPLSGFLLSPETIISDQSSLKTQLKGSIFSTQLPLNILPSGFSQPINFSFYSPFYADLSLSENVYGVYAIKLWNHNPWVQIQTWPLASCIILEIHRYLKTLFLWDWKHCKGWRTWFCNVQNTDIARGMSPRLL